MVGWTARVTNVGRRQFMKLLEVPRGIDIFVRPQK